MFQSYLYGIEMSLLTWANNPPICFNRTFMELKFMFWWLGSKVNKIVSIVPLWNWNRYVLELLSIGRTVSIVPLWNWNNFSSREAGAVIEFQSYLYGIEIFVLRNESMYRQVSIVPLWNWNTHRVPHQEMFYIVSIVPLWNWNIKGSMSDRGG